MHLRVGTAGYVYPHWRGSFYPRNLNQSSELSHYLTQYPSVEINATWHAFPRLQTLQKWHAAAKPQTTFALKAPKLITHEKRLRDTSHDIISFFKTASDGLRDHLGPILFQCPPSLSLSIPLLAAFLQDIQTARSACPRSIRVAVEFRHPDWMSDTVFQMLFSNDVALVRNVRVQDADFSIVEKEVSIPEKYRLPWSYTRFHGSKTQDVFTNFPDSVLRERARTAVEAGGESFVFFLNDLDALATKNARRFTELFAEEARLSVGAALGGFVPGWKKERSIASFFSKTNGSVTTSPKTTSLFKRTLSDALVSNVASPVKSGKAGKLRTPDGKGKDMAVVGGVRKKSNSKRLFFTPKRK